MLKAQPMGVQAVTSKPNAGLYLNAHVLRDVLQKEILGGSVEFVAHERIPGGPEMYANLMLAPGVRPAAHHCVILQSLWMRATASS